MNKVLEPMDLGESKKNKTEYRKVFCPCGSSEVFTVEREISKGEVLSLWLSCTICKKKIPVVSYSVLLMDFTYKGE